MAADGRHGQRCVYNSTYTTLRHDSIEKLLHSTIIGGIGRVYRQQRNMAGAGRTIPDLATVGHAVRDCGSTGLGPAAISTVDDEDAAGRLSPVHPSQDRCTGVAIRRPVALAVVQRHDAGRADTPP